MHCYIVQLSESPVESDCYIAEDDYCESYHLGSDWEHVENMRRSEGLEAFSDSLNPSMFKCSLPADSNMDDGEATLSILTGGRKQYFEMRHSSFCEALKRVQETNTLENFMETVSDLSAALYNLNNKACDKEDIWVDFDGHVMAFDAFMRHATEDTTYYIGGFVDYHV